MAPDQSRLGPGIPFTSKLALAGASLMETAKTHVVPPWKSPLTRSRPVWYPFAIGSQRPQLRSACRLRRRTAGEGGSPEVFDKSYREWSAFADGTTVRIDGDAGAFEIRLSLETEK